MSFGALSSLYNFVNIVEVHVTDRTFGRQQI